MFNNSNSSDDSQHFNAAIEQKKITDTLYRCSEEELLLTLHAKKVERAIDSTDVRNYLLYSDSAASSILRRLADPTKNKRLKTPIMKLEGSGARGAWLYLVREEVRLEDIERICQERKYSYQEYKKKKNSKQDDATSQEESDKISTEIPTQEHEVNSYKEEKEQTKASKTVDSEDASTKSVEPDDSLPYVFEVFKNQLAERENKLAEQKNKLAEQESLLAEKDRVIQQLKSELARVTTLVLERP